MAAVPCRLRKNMGESLIERAGGHRQPGTHTNRIRDVTVPPVHGDTVLTHDYRYDTCLTTSVKSVWTVDDRLLPARSADTVFYDDAPTQCA
jgi:hypothetical protein